MKWYKQKNFQYSVVAILSIFMGLTIGISIVDGFFTLRYFLYGLGFVVFVAIPFQYHFRNNP
jgi:uncharacterized membrane protein YgaE (UPF0421/DUF939 family)